MNEVNDEDNKNVQFMSKNSGGTVKKQNEGNVAKIRAFQRINNGTSIKNNERTLKNVEEINKDDITQKKINILEKDSDVRNGFKKKANSSSIIIPDINFIDNMNQETENTIKNSQKSTILERFLSKSNKNIDQLNNPCHKPKEPCIQNELNKNSVRNVVAKAKKNERKSTSTPKISPLKGSKYLDSDAGPPLPSKSKNEVLKDEMAINEIENSDDDCEKPKKNKFPTTGPLSMESSSQFSDVTPKRKKNRPYKLEIKPKRVSIEERAINRVIEEKNNNSNDEKILYQISADSIWDVGIYQVGKPNDAKYIHHLQSQFTLSSILNKLRLN